MNLAATAQQIENWPIERMVEYPRNPRKNDKAVDRMCASIREFGFKIPVLARSDGEVVDGHLRLKAARKLGIKEIPVILCDEWTPAQVKAFRLMVNRSVTWADWDEELSRWNCRRSKKRISIFPSQDSIPAKSMGCWHSKTTRKRTLRRRCRSRRCRGWAIFGCLGSTGSSAATPRAPRSSRDYWAVGSHGSSSRTRRMGSSLIPNGATARGLTAAGRLSQAT